MSSSLLIFGAVLTAVTAVGGAAVAALGVLWEIIMFVRSGYE